MLFRIILLVLALARPFASRAEKPAAPPPSSVTRAEAIATAQRYLLLKWKPTAANVLHGKDPVGIRVDTPDEAFKPVNSFPGWWRSGATNQGMPYKWGGFDTPESFLAGVAAGRAAGDVYTAEKRRLLDAGVSEQVVGIDCSGFISRCWGLPKSYSTRSLPGLCVGLKDYAELRPGDIVNLHNAHVLLFAGWARPDHSRLLAYETGSPPTWKVLLNDMDTQALQKLGYKAWRYRGIRE
jgi:cell wall-associated NlpC family hydrolase